MTIIYTSVEQRYNKIFFRGYKDGKRIQTDNAQFKPMLYVPSEVTTGIKSLYGEDLRSMEFDTIGEAKAFAKSYKDVMNVHGNDRFEYDFIHRNFKGEQAVTINDITVVSMDIETTVGGGLHLGKQNFPDVMDPEDEVLLITLQNINTSKLTTFGSRPYSAKDSNYILCKNEADLLQKFINFIINIDPDIITGWNVIKFDIAYLGSRIIKILGQNAWNRISPFNIVDRKIDNVMGQESLRYDIKGRTVLDLLELYKKFRFINRSSYKLENIAQIELGEGKRSHDGSFKDHYTNHWESFVEYNIQDTILVSKLESKLGMIYLAVVLASLTKINFSDVYSPVKMWESYILSTLLEKNTFCKLKTEHSSDHQIIGGYVKEPTPGMYKWPVSFDMNSMYPSIMVALNMSPETIIDLDPNTIPLLEQCIKIEDNCTHALNGSKYSKDKVGVLSSTIKHVMDSRKIAKNKMLDLKKQKEAISVELQRRGVHV